MYTDHKDHVSKNAGISKKFFHQRYLSNKGQRMIKEKKKKKIYSLGKKFRINFLISQFVSDFQYTKVGF